MTTYNTGNPVPSADPRDRFDNSENFDSAVNGMDPTWVDRLGVPRKAWAGFEQDFAAFLAGSGFEPIVLQYVDGSPLTVDRPTQLIERASTPGILYSVKLPSVFPVTLSGVWTDDEDILVVRVDGSLRDELAAPTGADQVGYGTSTVADELEYLAGSTHLIRASDGENITTKLLAAIFAGAKVVRLPAGTFLFDNPLTVEPGFRGFVLEGAGLYLTTLKATVTGQPSVIMARTAGSTASFYQNVRDLTIDGDGKATVFRNASAYGNMNRVRSINHVDCNYHATGLVNLHTGCIFPINPNGVLCTNATLWISHNANYFQGCYVHGGGAAGTAIRINTGNGLECVKNSFHHCTIENGKLEIENGAYAVSIDDNYLEQIKITATGNCDGLVITNNRGAEAQPFIHLNNVNRAAAVKIADNNLSFDIYLTVNNREGAANDVLDFYQFPELHIHHNGRRQQPILINGAVACDFLSVQRARIPEDVSSARVSIKGVYKLLPAEATPAAQVMLKLYLRAATSALDGYFIEERTYARRPPTGVGGVDPYRANYWDARGYAEYPAVSGGTTGATARTVIYERNPAALAVTYAIVSNGANSKRWEMSVVAEANRETYYSSDFELTQIS